MSAPYPIRIELACDVCTYRTRLDPDTSRLCPACLSWMRLDYVRPLAVPEPASIALPVRPRRVPEPQRRWRGIADPHVRRDEIPAPTLPLRDRRPRRTGATRP